MPGLNGWTCVVTGNTFPIRHGLMSWAFYWDAETKAWRNSNVDNMQRKIIQSKIDAGEYPDCNFNWEENEADEMYRILAGENLLGEK